MTALPLAQTVLRAHSAATHDSCTLDYDARFLRRKRLTSDGGLAFLVDLSQTTSLDHGDALALTDGRHIQILAAPEPLYAITGDLVRLAWHIGNRHTPCQIETDRLLIQRDKVIGHMLEHLGATLTEVSEPFTPEGGAYGHGRTHAHEHVHTAHEH
jgi:urease accessory protein